MPVCWTTDLVGQAKSIFYLHNQFDELLQLTLDCPGLNWAWLALFRTTRTSMWTTELVELAEKRIEKMGILFNFFRSILGLCSYSEIYGLKFITLFIFSISVYEMSNKAKKLFIIYFPGSGYEWNRKNIQLNRQIDSVEIILNDIVGY